MHDRVDRMAAQDVVEEGAIREAAHDQRAAQGGVAVAPREVIEDEHVGAALAFVEGVMASNVSGPAGHEDHGGRKGSTRNAGRGCRRARRDTERRYFVGPSGVEASTSTTWTAALSTMPISLPKRYLLAGGDMSIAAWPT